MGISQEACYYQTASKNQQITTTNIFASAEIGSRLFSLLGMIKISYFTLQILMVITHYFLAYWQNQMVCGSYVMLKVEYTATKILLDRNFLR